MLARAEHARVWLAPRVANVKAAGTAAREVAAEAHEGARQTDARTAWNLQ